MESVITVMLLLASLPYNQNNNNQKDNQMAISPTKSPLPVPVYQIEEGAISSFKAEPYTFLSNFYPCTVKDPEDEITYPNSESFYQASKFLQKQYRLRFRFTKGWQAKVLARHLSSNIRRDFKQVNVQFMEEILRIKFAPNSRLAGLLIATQGRQLVEGNQHSDTFWGVCNHTGRGQNNLGEILMQIRSDLIQQKAIKSFSQSN